MPLSQNGWSANDRSVITTIPVPGGTLPVRQGDVAVVFEWLAQRFNDDVEPLKWPGCWGYAERPIRGGTELSNHASGTAVDFNAPAHPLGKVGTFTAAQVKAIHAILADADGVIRWGGNYSGRKDEMHFEINAPAARVAALAHKLKEDPMPTTEEIAHDVMAYEYKGRQVLSYIVTADTNARNAARDSAQALAIVKALAAKPTGLSADEITAAAKAGAAQALSEEIDSATVQLNVTGGQA